MAVLRVEDIETGRLDSTGASILIVYAKVSRRYAVYRTADQVLIQFADDDQEGVNQRAALAPLASLRAQISGLVAALRARQSAYDLNKAADYDHSVGLALAVALQGDLQGANSALVSIKDELTEDRASDVRVRHLLYAASATLSVIVLARFLASSWFGAAFGRFDASVSPLYWTAAAVGGLGALFSIALQIRSRQVSIDLQSWDNFADAVLRIFVGAASAVILIALLNTKAVDLMVAGKRLVDSMDGVIIAAFAAGFTERLVADFLSGFSVVGRPAVPTATPLPKPSGTNERTVAEGFAAGQAPPSEPPTVAKPPVVSNPELAAEPDEDQIEATEGESPSTNETVSRSLGPVG